MRFVIPPLGDIYRDIEDRLEGAPDFILSAILLLAGTVMVWAAFKAPASLKAVMIGWVVLP